MTLVEKPPPFQKERLSASRLFGIWVPVVTPKFNDSTKSKVDVVSQALLIQYLIQNGVHGIFLNSNIGGGRIIPKEEWLISVINGVEEVRKSGKNIPVVAGVLRKELSEMIELALEAERIGVDGLVVAPYFGVSVENARNEAINRVSNILTATDLPIILYTNPDFQPYSGPLSGMQMPIDFVQEVAQNPRIIGIKDTSRDPEFFERLLKLRSDNFHVLQGYTRGGLDALNNGADGMVPAEANTDPELLVRLYSEKDSQVMEEVAALAGNLFGEEVDFRQVATQMLREQKILSTEADIFGTDS